MEWIAAVSGVLGTSGEVFVTQAIALVSGFVAVGLAAGAVVDIFKQFFPVRDWFFRLKFRGFLTAGGAGLEVDKVEYHIARLGAGGVKHFYRQDLAGLIASIQDAVGVLKSFPEDEKYQWAFLTLVGSCPPGAVERLRELSEKLSEEEQNEKERKEHTALIARFSVLIDARLKGFKINLEYWWGRAQRLAAIVISVVLIFMFLHEQPLEARLILGIVGGVFAPFAHDVRKTLNGAKA